MTWAYRNHYITLSLSVSVYIYIYGLRAKRAVKGFSLQEVEIVFFFFFSLSYKAGPSLTDHIQQFSTTIVLL